jgi:hypothetical protein
MVTAVVASLFAATAAAAATRTAEPSQVTGVNGWEARPISTIGEEIKGHVPPGIPDGMSAYASRGSGVMSAYVNHELVEDAGYAYELANGTELTGARLSRYDIQTRTLKTVDSGLAYDTIYDVDGQPVTDPEQVNPVNTGEAGISRLCSARGVSAGEYGFVDDIHFAGEEQTNGVLFALDNDAEELWAVPDMGLLAWESVSPIETGDEDTIALLVGDDREAAPLWLYVGEKRGGGFLERNGLVGGQLYVWVADANDPSGTFDSPAEFFGNGTTADGYWAAVDARNADGSLRTTAELDAAADAVGHFQFSRPEDVHDNPTDAQELVLASTGRTSWDGGSDVYGTTYLVNVAFGDGQPTGAELTILYDGDEAYDTVGPNEMLRSPDNLTWASDGYIYIQEDRATSADWGTVEASIWQLDPTTPGAASRVAIVDRNAVPERQVDTEPDDLGAWETSGIIDVTHLVKTRGADVALLFNVQAHSLTGGAITEYDLVQGGQIGLLTR